MAEDRPPAPDDDEFPPWIDRVAGVAAALGMNRVRVRWRLQRWHNGRRAARRRREQAVEHVRYEHRVCRRCTAVNDRAATACARCGEGLGTRAGELLGRLGLHAPVVQSISALLGLAILAVYVRTVVAAGGRGAWELPIDVLVVHGGNLPSPFGDGEPWRLATSVFLHAGMIHLAFNLISLAIVGPMVEETYGRWVTLWLFVTTGVAASFGSRELGLDGVGIGASGAIMGLIGAAAAAAHRSGTTRDRHVRNDLLKWALYVLVFGWIVGADNRAHVAGFVAGAAFGLVASPRWLRGRSARPVVVVLGAVGAIVAVGAVALTMAPRVGALALLGM